MAFDTRARRRCSGLRGCQHPVDRRIARAGSEVSAFALLASVTLEGIPENMALGVSLLEVASEPGAAIALLVAIFASNLPEALGGGGDMRSQVRSRTFVIGAWAATGVLLAPPWLSATLCCRARAKSYWL
jgi:zinc transporter ZupT